MDTPNEEKTNVQKQDPKNFRTVLESIPNPTSRALVEFKQWKKTIIDMIRKKSSLQFYDDSNYKFILPPGLVRLVWDVTINERIAAQDATLPRQERIKKAYDSLQQDLSLVQNQRAQFEIEKAKAIAAKATQTPVEAPKNTPDSKHAEEVNNRPTEPQGA
jgi:hypothetical protein